MIKIKRVYDLPSKDDGERFLVERLWPRGIRKEALCITGWLKDLAPSHDLRKWFSHDLKKWEEFKKRYELELEEPEKQNLLKQLAQKALNQNITLLYSARDTKHNSAVVLKQILEKYIHGERP
ncbi:hypothetical protein HRbin37_02086 [bacterium HR37]|nr:hypothetical protein HRbin37_02086 [bacterium HR37]